MLREEALAVLGLSEGHTEAQLRTAYKAACLAHHPDKHGGDKDAFLRVREAYTTLNNTPFTHEHEESLIKFFFVWIAWVLKTRQTISKNPCLEIDIDVTFQEVYNGCVKKIVYRRLKFDGNYYTETLYLELTNFRSTYVLPNKGDLDGDVKLRLCLQNDTDFRMDDLISPYDLYVTTKISVYEYYYGVCYSETVLPDGRRVSEGFVPCREGSVRVLPAHGLPYEADGVQTRGDLFVMYEVDMHRRTFDVRTRVQDARTFDVRTRVQDARTFGEDARTRLHALFHGSIESETNEEGDLPTESFLSP